MLLLEVAFVSGPKDRRFKSRQGQIGHSVANGSLPLRHFFERSCVIYSRNDAEMAPPTRYTLRRNAARIIKDLIELFECHYGPLVRCIDT